MIKRRMEREDRRMGRRGMRGNIEMWRKKRWKREEEREEGTEERLEHKEEVGKKRAEGGERGGKDERRKEGRPVTHRGLCFFLQSHIRTVFCIMTQALVRYRILFFTAGDRKEGRKEGSQVPDT